MAIDMISYLMGQQAGGGGSEDKGSNYKSITENQDGTYTVVDSDDASHTISITEADDAITVTLDGDAVPILLDTDGNIVKIGNSDISVAEQCEGGGNIGYQVTFKINGNDYYIASCQQGESITEPPTPTMQGKTFGGWLVNGSFITFPYTPTADVEATALLTTRNYLVANNETITVMRGFTFSCRNLVSGLVGNEDIVGYGLGSDGKTGVFLITKVSRDNAIERTPSSLFENATNAITYNGETYYYARLAPFVGSEADTSELNRFQITNGLTNDEAAIEILTAFYSEATI